MKKQTYKAEIPVIDFKNQETQQVLVNASMYLIGCALEMGAETLEYTAEDVTKDEAPAGNWKVKITKVNDED